MSIAGANATDDQVDSFIAMLAEHEVELFAVKSKNIRSQIIPGGISYQTQPSEWLIPIGPFEAWVKKKGFHLDAGASGGDTWLAPIAAAAPSREKATEKYKRLLLEILSKLGIDHTTIKKHKGGGQKCEEKQRAKALALTPAYKSQGFTERTFAEAWQRLPKVD